MPTPSSRLERYWHKKTSFSRSTRWPAVKPPIICGELSVPRDKPLYVESELIFSSRCQAEQAADRGRPQTLFFCECQDLNQSTYAKASVDTPSSTDLRVACHPKLEERRVVEPDGIEPTTPCLQSRCSPS